MAQTVPDLLALEKMLWLEKARETARELLRTHRSITIEHVLARCPKPGYLHRNVVGGVFQHGDFKVTGYALAKKPSSHRRLIREWSLGD